MEVVRKFLLLCKTLPGEWRRHNVSWLAAAVAYYTLFSLAPTFVIVITIGGTFFGEEAVKGLIVQRLQNIVDLQTAVAIQKMIEAGQHLTIGTFPKIFTIGILLLAATNVFTHLKVAINQIWEISTTERHWFINLLMNRFFSVIMIFSIAVLLLALVFVDVILASFGKILAEFVPAFTYVYIWQIGNILVSFFITSLLFALIYKQLPDTRIYWKDVWAGASIGGFLFTIGKFFIGLYLGKSRLLSVFGAASSFVMIMIWVYYSVQILFLGAEISRVYAELWGSRSGKHKSPRKDEKSSKRTKKSSPGTIHKKV
ncbi:MAG: YihY/virulence factor BrkB family protein [Calditrichaeota bacterium]|nr:MAG: YihY/virulence factor BrkB family protein [Calditrichota bacterium]